LWLGYGDLGRLLNLRRRRDDFDLGYGRYIRLGLLYGKDQLGRLHVAHFFLMHLRHRDQDQNSACNQVDYRAHSKGTKTTLRLWKKTEVCVI